MAKSKVQDEELERLLAEGQDVDPFEKEEVAPIVQEFEFDYASSMPVKRGVYHGKVIEFSGGVSDSGNPKFVVKIRFPQINRSMELHMPRTPNSAWITGARLQALGIKPVEGSIARFKAADVIDNLCRCLVDNEEYKPKKRPDDPEDFEPEAKLIPKIIEIMAPSRETVDFFGER